MADLARQFNAAAERIETLVKSHQSLLANASHELRSPLTRIRMGLELTAAAAPSPTFRAEILRNIAELDQLVDEILLASRLDAREADVGTVEDVDLIGLAAEDAPAWMPDLDVSAVPEGLEVRGISKAAAPRHSQPAGKRAPLQHGENHGAGAAQRCRGRECACATAARACRWTSASGIFEPSTACPAPASARAAWAWGWRWCGPSPGGTTAACTAKTTPGAAPALCCACRWR